MKDTLEIVQTVCLALIPLAIITFIAINSYVSTSLRHETCYQRLGYNESLNESFIIDNYCGGKDNH